MRPRLLDKLLLCQEVCLCMLMWLCMRIVCAHEHVHTLVLFVFARHSAKEDYVDFWAVTQRLLCSHKRT
jgi:hypothetical protein